jgi:serine/threonine protein kinase
MFITEDYSRKKPIEELNQLFAKYSFVKETDRSSAYYLEYNVFEKEYARHSNILVIDLLEFGESKCDRLKSLLKISKNLSHPNLIKIRDYWIHEDSMYVVVNEILGIRLDRFIDQGRLSLKRTLEISIQLAALLEYMHEEKIYHGGIWPKSVYVDSNYFVSVDPPFLSYFLFNRFTDDFRKSEASSYVTLDKEVESLGRKDDIRALGSLVCYLATGYAPDMMPSTKWVEYGLDEKLVDLVGRSTNDEKFRQFTMVDEVIERLEAVQTSRFAAGISNVSMKTKMHRLKATSKWAADTAVISGLKASPQAKEFEYDTQVEEHEKLLNKRYRVGACVQAEGTSKIFEAEDRHMANRKIWIHVLDFNGSPDWSYNFRVLAQKLYEVRHPHICQVFDYALLEEIAYISSQREGGDRLSTFRKRHRFRVADIKQFIYQILGALATAQQCGFQCYSLNPETISVYAHPDGGYFYRLLCVGGYQLMSLDHAEDALLDSLKHPEWLAPEVFNGELKGFRTTQFILGNIIYQLMFGYHPCENLSLENAYIAHSSIEGIPFPDGLEPQMQELADWVKIMIHRDPIMRFETPEQMAREIFN